MNTMNLQNTINPNVLSSLTDLVVGTNLNDEDLVYTNYFRNFLKESSKVEPKSRLSTIQLCTVLTEVGSKIPATLACKYGKFIELMSKRNNNAIFWV